MYIFHVYHGSKQSKKENTAQRKKRQIKLMIEWPLCQYIKDNIYHSSGQNLSG